MQAGVRRLIFVRHAKAEPPRADKKKVRRSPKRGERGERGEPCYSLWPHNCPRSTYAAARTAIVSELMF